MAVGQPAQLADTGLRHAFEQHDDAGHHGDQQTIEHPEDDDGRKSDQHHRAVAPPVKVRLQRLPVE